MPYMALAALVMSGFLPAAEVKDPAAATGADQKAALACFQAFLDGLGKRDKAAMLAQLLPTIFTNSKSTAIRFSLLHLATGRSM
jgi:hypothetical protein